jgi:hypothetical protein
MGKATDYQPISEKPYTPIEEGVEVPSISLPKGKWFSLLEDPAWVKDASTTVPDESHRTGLMIFMRNHGVKTKSRREGDRYRVWYVERLTE